MAIDQTVDVADERAHPLGSDEAWSESYYFYYADPASGIGAFTRMGFRPKNGWADGLHVAYLGGERIAFCYARRDHTGGEQDLQVGGLRLECDEPFRRWVVDYDGPAEDVADGRVLVTPRKERPEGWFAPETLRMHVDFAAVADPYYFWRGEHGHFEQIGRARGELSIGGDDFELDGWGLRDKSWGPRTWQSSSAEPAASPSEAAAGQRTFTMWLTATFGADLAFAVTAVPGRTAGGGFLMRDGQNLALTDVAVESEYEPGSVLHRSCRVTALTETGETFAAEATVIGMAPTKIAIPGGATLVNEGLARWTTDGGRSGCGIAEYWVSVSR